jgi:hypothetical protein
MLGNVVIMLAVRLPNAVGLNYRVNRVATGARDGHSSRNVIAVSVVVVEDNEVLLDTSLLRSDCMPKTCWTLAMTDVFRLGHHLRPVLAWEHIDLEARLAVAQPKV